MGETVPDTVSSCRVPHFEAPTKVGAKVCPHHIGNESTAHFGGFFLRPLGFGGQGAASKCGTQLTRTAAVGVICLWLAAGAAAAGARAVSITAAFA